MRHPQGSFSSGLFRETVLKSRWPQGADVEPGHPRPLILDITVDVPLLNKDQAQGRNEELSVYLPIDRFA